MTKRFLENTKILITASFISCVTFAHAQEASVFTVNAKLGFFNHEAVSDMNQPLEYTRQQDIEMGPSKGFDLSNEFKVDNSQNNKAPQQQSGLPATEDKIPEGVDPQEYTLKKEFGDPSDPVPVKGTDTAPKPYRAMLKAIDMGRDDLALQYAEQWMGYMKSLDKVVKKASEMAGMVELDPSQKLIEDSYAGNIDPHAVKTYLASKKNRRESSDVKKLELDTETKGRIDDLFGEKPETQKATAPELSKDEYYSLSDKTVDADSRRILIRSKLANQLPVEAGGSVKILFFLRPSESVSMQVAKEIANVIASPTLNVQVSVVPLTLDKITSDINKSFFQVSGLPAVLREGASLARTFDVREAPTLLFLNSGGEQAFVKSGFSDSVFIEEVVKIMGGK